VRQGAADLVPVKKLAGVFKGKAPVEAVADLQILANDTINEAPTPPTSRPCRSS
jgi:hypothetical protein